MTFEETMEQAKLHPDQYEVRCGYYGGLVVTSQMIKDYRFKLEMDQHYKEEQEEHDLLIYALKLRLDIMYDKV
jgi:hypothetical protein